MKKICLLIFLLIAAIYSNAQSSEGKRHIIKAGHGIPGMDALAIRLIDRPRDKDESFGETQNTIGAFFIKYEYKTKMFATIGINTSYTSGEISISDEESFDGSFTREGYTNNYESYSILARINFLPKKTRTITPYMGFAIGYREMIKSYHFRDPDDQNYKKRDTESALGGEATFGVNVRFTERVGMYSEFGFAKALLQYGLFVNF
jgi:hypothetical protein